MIGLVTTLAIAAAASSPEWPAALNHRLASPAEVKHAMIRCGLPAKSVSVRFEPSEQEDVVWVARSSGPLSPLRLNCIARASLKTIYYVYFREKAVQQRYNKLYSSVSYSVDVATAREWLRERNRLASLPLPKKDKPLSTYAEAVETFCSIKEGSLLVASDEHFMTFAKDGLGKMTESGFERSITNDAFECVMNAISAADLRARGIDFGIVGNAAPATR